jgi:hypothetical protein
MTAATGTLRAIAGALWSRRGVFALAALAVAATGQLLVLTILSRGFTQPPDWLRVHDVGANVARIWRRTPALADVIELVPDEPVLEFGRRSRAFLGVTWSYQVTIHTIVDTALGVLVVAAGIAVGVAYHRRACATPTGGRGVAGSIGSWSLLSLVGTGTGAACCGAVPTSLLATALGAGAPVVFALGTYGRLLIALGYAVLIGNLLYAGYRLHRLPSSD